ncbi:MAG: 4Fe-4S binding protein [Sedimentisphaerales bacterium]|nr:4Fe-4S binding protein [Sedimentisphaerales bacterium]
MRFARGLLIFSYGLFSIAAQTLIFREFVTTFEGNDISVGIFFGSWFLWIGFGAMLVRKSEALAEKLIKGFELLLLAYPPAFILQAILIIQARELAGIESYALWSIRDILLISIIINAPISLITGMLFPIACRWIDSVPAGKGGNLPVSRVYMLEAAGSFAGGIGVTILLGFGISSASIFLLLTFMLSVSVFICLLAGIFTPDTRRAARIFACALSFLVPVVVCLCFVRGYDEILTNRMQFIKWTKLLPKEAFVGSFQTAQAEYLYGTYQGQWVVIREGSVADALPDESSAGRIAAIILCQKPDAKKILVIGSGLGLCRGILQLPQIEKVAWTHCDSEYVQKVNEFIPSQLKITDERFEPHTADVRSLLAEERESFDIVILNLPDATSSVLNRYFTLESYQQIKESLSPTGILAVRTAGGENIMGTELINLGASMKLTLEKVFSKLVLAPGEETWFIASDSESVTSEPGILRGRFASINGAESLFTPEALLSVYLPDRAAAAMKNYSSADLPERFLINRDSRPLTHLYSLLLAARQSGAPAARLVKHLVPAGPTTFLIPILIVVILRALYILQSTGQSKASSFDGSFLVFSAGAVGIGAVIVLMYLYQTRLGLLYLHIGIVSSLFMAGLTAGAVLIRCHLQQEKTNRNEKLLLLVIFIHSLLLCAIAFWPGGWWSQVTFAAALVLCGACTGCYFPIAAGQLADSGFDTGRAGSILETSDHIGAAVGGAVTSLALVPVLGTTMALLVSVTLILANVPQAAMRLYKPSKIWSSEVATLRFRSIGYVLFGIGASVVLCSNLLAYAGAGLRLSLPIYSAHALAGEMRIEQQSAVIDEGARKVDYFRVFDANDVLTGYIFSSEDLAPEVRGFGGKINLAVHVDDPNGRLIGFHIIRSNETPVYLELLADWCKSLIGRELYQPEPFAHIQAVTGATISSEAVLSALGTSGQRFAAEVLGKTTSPLAEQRVHLAKYLPDNSAIYLIAAFIAALIVTYFGGFWSRLIVLGLSLGIGGIWLNAQYSSEQIVTILSGLMPALAMTGTFLLVVGVPLLVIIFGNLYCGYICPFGAAQELIGYVLPGRFKPSILNESMRKARFVKYVILLIVVIVFFASRDRTTLVADPLISIFGLRLTTADFRSALIIIVAASLIGSLFWPRFWCRYLCPAGAFLSLLNRAAVLKRYLPAKKFGRCPYGLTGKDNADCIQCDKCRFEEFDRAATKRKEITGAFAACVIIVALFISVVSADRFLKVIPSGSEAAAVSASGGQPRDVDIQRVRTMIQQNRLSDKEAEFYKKVD